MNKYVMDKRTISMEDRWDVIVVGGGPSGCTAATAASKEGARTLLIEATGCLGGMGTSGLLPAWCPFSDREKIIYRGLAEEIFNQLKRVMPHVDKEDTEWVPIDAEKLKIIYDDIVTGAGVTVLFNTFVTAVDMHNDGSRISAVIAANKYGLMAYRSKIYVDCTGDGDIAAWAGAEIMKGDGGKTDLQPATHCFTLSNVDEYAYSYEKRIYPDNMESPIFDILKSGKYSLIKDKHIVSKLIGPRVVGFNAGHIWGVDNTNPYSVSKALMHGRKMAAAYRDALAEYFPSAFAGARVEKTGSLMGVRETRRVKGDYVLTLEDYMQRKNFDDEIGRNSYFIDVHETYEQLKKTNYKAINLERDAINYATGESHGIPYRCLTPKGLKNVLVAGRCISSDRKVNGSIRVMPVCLVTGEAAGQAAFLASGIDNYDVHAVDTDILRKRLKENGAYLP